MPEVNNSVASEITTNFLIPSFLKQQKGTIVDRHIVNGKCLERVEAFGKSAAIYRRDSDIMLRRYNVDFDILNAVYATFKSKTVEEVHLCLIGEWRIDFHELIHDEHCMLTLPFKICKAHCCSFGLLLERDCFSNSEVQPDSAQLFSLTHPYNEFFPVVSRFKDDVDCYYAFRNRRIALFPNACRYDKLEKRELVYGYNFENNSTSIFRLRHCSREEKTSAKNEMWMDARGFFNLSIDSPARAAASGQSFLSPNFFNKNFLSEGKRELLTNDACSIATISPLTAQTSFSSYGKVAGCGFENNSFMAATTSKITPIRRHSMQTRSMASTSVSRVAAHVMSSGGGGLVGGYGESVDSIFQVRSGGSLISSCAISSAEILNQYCNSRLTNSNNLLHYALNQQRRLRCTSTPINFTETEKLLTFCNSNSMECSVEFCLEWIEDSATLPIDFLSPTSSAKSILIKGAVNELIDPVVTGFSTIVHYETPQQQKSGNGHNHYGKEFGKNQQGRYCLPKTERQQRLEILDDLFMKKFNSKCNFVYASRLRESSVEMLTSERKKYCLQRWGDNRLHNVTQMLDSSKSVLIPSKLEDNENLQQELRDQQMQFLMTTALKTVTRPFGQALLNFATVRPIPNEPFVVNPICFNGKINPSGMQMDYPLTESNTKTLIEWASFYNGVAHGLAVLGFDSFTRQCVNRNTKGKRCAKDKSLAVTEKKRLTWHQSLQLAIASTSKNSLWENYCDVDGGGTTPADDNASCRQHRRYESGNSSLRNSLRYSQRQTSVDKNGSSFTTGSGRRRQSLVITNVDHSMLTTEGYGDFHDALFEEELLKIRQEFCQPNSTKVVFDWNWLCMNLQAHKDIPPVQAGFLFAAGLTGHIISVPEHDIHKYVEKSEKFKTLAVTLGRAVAFRGTSDVHVYKLLTTHLPFLMQPTLCEFRFEMVVQTAAVVGLGYLFAESMNQSLSSQLINQMSREIFDSDQGGTERYSFVLAAGFAVGLINLGKGKLMTNTEPPIANGHLSLTDRLVKLMNGGEQHLCFVHYDCVSYCPAGATGIDTAVNGGSISIRRYADGSTATAEGCGIAGNMNKRLNSTSSHIRQMQNVNIHLTSPAACIALGLMYLKTGDQWITKVLTIPNTLFAIEKIRPDVLMLRVLAKCLINFDQIGTSMKYLDDQIPEIVKKYVKHFMNNSKKDVWWTTFVDINCVAQAYFYCAAGACMAIALRFASTSELSVKRTIETFYSRIEADGLVTSTECEKNGSNEYKNLSIMAGKNCVYACINVCAISLALVMAGSGDLSTLQILRKIRNLKRLNVRSMAASTSTALNTNKEASIHSLHISLNMAIGLLCLGNGRLSLAKSNMAIASLLISMFPIFPHSLLDNRTYLQPLRFLWTLATETRFLVTVDSESLVPVTVEICVTFKNDSRQSLVSRTPLILPPLHQISTISLGSSKTSNNINEYKPVMLDFRRPRDLNKLNEVLNRCYGRFPMLKRDTLSEVKVKNFVDFDNLLLHTLSSINVNNEMDLSEK